MEKDYLPIVAALVKKYTGGKSNSLPLEIGEQLGEAVLYCIDTFHRYGSGLTVDGRASAEYCYGEGLRLVKERVAAAMARYRRVTEIFDSYGNSCLESVIRKGIPAFFEKYSPEFEPQNTVLTLDYPVFADLTAKCGAERIDSFLACIDAEQRFLMKLEREYLLGVLKKHRCNCEDAVENICFPVLLDIICRKLLQKPLLSGKFTAEEIGLLQEKLKCFDKSESAVRISSFLNRLVQVQYQNSEQIGYYLQLAVPDLAVRLLTAAEHGVLKNII